MEYYKPDVKLKKIIHMDQAHSAPAQKWGLGNQPQYCYRYGASGFPFTDSCGSYYSYRDLTFRGRPHRHYRKYCGSRKGR